MSVIHEKNQVTECLEKKECMCLLMREDSGSISPNASISSPFVVFTLLLFVCTIRHCLFLFHKSNTWGALSLSGKMPIKSP